jgi:hypothetical protein
VNLSQKLRRWPRRRYQQAKHEGETNEKGLMERIPLPRQGIYELNERGDIAMGGESDGSREVGLSRGGDTGARDAHMLRYYGNESE